MTPNKHKHEIYTVFGKKQKIESYFSWTQAVRGAIRPVYRDEACFDDTKRTDLRSGRCSEVDKARGEAEARSRGLDIRVNQAVFEASRIRQGACAD